MHFRILNYFLKIVLGLLAFFISSTYIPHLFTQNINYGLPLWLQLFGGGVSI